MRGRVAGSTGRADSGAGINQPGGGREVRNRPKTKAGAGECYACGREVVWRKTQGGALSCFCQHCDSQGYAKDKTEAERLILRQLGADPAAAPQPAPTPGAPGAPADKPKPPKTGAFGLAGF